MRNRDVPGLAIALLASAVLSLAHPAAAQLRVGEVVEARVGSPHPYPNGSLQPRVVWSHVFHHPGATFLKIRFASFAVAGAIEDGTPAGDYVVVRTPDGAVRELLSGTGREEFWSRSLGGDTAIVELHADGEQNAAGLEIDAYGYGEIPIETRTVCGSDETTGVCDAAIPERARLSDPVARILFASDCGGIFLCTGFLFSPEGLLMTNAHCGNSTRESRSMEVWFNYTEPGEAKQDCSLPDRPNPDVFRAEKRVFADCALDVAIHRIDSDEKGNPADRYGFLLLTPRAPQAGEAIWVPQHPSGRPRQVSETGIVSAALLEGTDFCSDRPSCSSGEGVPTGAMTELGHTADTGPGSSGSPILDEQNQVIGLHHAGGCSPAGGENTAVLMARILPLLGQAPRARLETSPRRLTGAAPFTVELDGSGSFDPDGGAIVEYHFDPGDGSPVVVSATPRLSHTYALPGRFKAQLSVVDDESTRSKRPFSRRVHAR